VWRSSCVSLSRDFSPETHPSIRHIHVKKTFFIVTFTLAVILLQIQVCLLPLISCLHEVWVLLQHWSWGFSSSQILYCTVANVTYPNISKEHSITCNRVSRSHTEDGGNTVLWNVSKYLPPVMTLLPRSLESPVIALLTCYHLTCGNCLFRIFYCNEIISLPYSCVCAFSAK